MNKTFGEADDLLNDIMTKLESTTLDANTQLIVCPPFPYLEMTSDYSDDSYFMVGAQNVSDQEVGAYTGEVSAAMLESLEIDYCIVGHSERRAYYHETNEIVARKVDQLLKHGLKPIVCCGEVLEEREANKQFEVVKQQITEGLFHLTPEQFGERGGRGDQHPVRRQLQAQQRQGAVCQQGCGRWPDWRCLAESRRLHRYRNSILILNSLFLGGT